MNENQNPTLHNVEHWDSTKSKPRTITDQSQVVDPSSALEKALELSDRIMNFQSTFSDNSSSNSLAEMMSLSLRLAGLIYSINKWIAVENRFPVQWVEKRDVRRAAKEIEQVLERQLPQGISNAANHVAACIDVLGR